MKKPITNVASDSVLINANKKFSLSATNLAVPSVIETISPSAMSTCASPTARARSKTFNKLTRYLRSNVSSSGAASGNMSNANVDSTKIQPATDQNHIEPPQIFISTKSLPESLTSGSPSILNCCPSGNRSTTDASRSSVDYNSRDESSVIVNDMIATVTNELPPNKSSYNLLQWKIPKYLRKLEGRNNNNSAKCDSDKCVINEPSPITINGNGNPAESGQMYQLLPIIIQKTTTENSLSPTDAMPMNTPSCSPSPRTVHHTDIIDIRSYISQSRSDIVPYPERSDSCRSRIPRSYFGEVSPLRRPRASTIALTSQEHLINGISGNELLRVPQHSNSRYGRKQSQQCSPTSQNQLQLPNVDANRTSISQERLSILAIDVGSWVSNISDDPISMEQSSTIAMPSSSADAHLDPSRKQSDLQLIRCVRDNAKSQQNYLVQPPLKKLSLFFKSPLMEREFRMKAHQFSSHCGPITIATPIYNTYIDIFIGIVIYSTVSTAMFLLSASEQFNDTSLKWFWFAMFGLFSAIELFALIVFTKKLFRRRERKHKSNKNKQQSTKTILPLTKITIQSEKCDSFTTIPAELTSDDIPSSNASSIPSSPTISCQTNDYLEDKIIGTISSWYKWHICLGILMSLPAVLTLIHYFIKNATHNNQIFDYHYGFLMLVCIIHFCNFTQLNYWMRNILAVCVALSFAISMSIYHINFPQPILFNHTIINPLANAIRNSTIHGYDNHFTQQIKLEIFIDLTLVLILVWFLNREFEIFYRFAFYGSAVAEKDKIRVQTMKNQADLLLQNIIPKHVAEHLKNTAKYSENHHNVAIIFASLVNFNELYDESYLGGREYLRVLNELIGDFDELLSRREFQCVEKIKTIGSTFMAASGLDNYFRDDNNSHVNSLMEFAMAMQDVVAAFNKDLLEFDLILRIGFNIGDITAGVIGTSKLHYDIWGDAVNVSSRMDSTGVSGQIQIGKDCIPFLDNDKYEFTPRGKVFVKGKDHMEVYLVKRKRLDTQNA